MEEEENLRGAVEFEDSSQRCSSLEPTFERGFDGEEKKEVSRIVLAHLRR